MAGIQRVGQATYQNTGTASVAVQNPVGAASGDKIVLVITSSAAAVGLATYTGWTLLLDATYNARRTFYLTRDYASSYSDITLSGPATAGSISMAFRAASGFTLSEPVIGTKWDRPANGGSQATTTMLSMTGAEDGITIAITAETSTGAESEGQVTFTGTDWTKWFYGDTDLAQAVSVVYWVGYRDLDGATPSGNVVSTWPNASTNSMGVQLTIGQTGSGGTMPTGNLDTVGVFQNSATSLTVGARKVSGGVVEAVLRQAGTEVARQAITFTSGRGNAAFTGLTPGTAYTVTFEVDGVVQTDAVAAGRTLRTGAASFVAVTGSCMFTGSMHPVFDRILADNPDFWTIQGDIHYEDATTEAGWWAGMVTSLNALRALPRKLTTRWTPDNHDTIRTTPLGGGAPALPPVWKQMAGSAGWGSADSVGQAWQNGRVLFVQPDLRSMRDNYAVPDPAPLKMLGTAQKTWFKDLLTAAETDPSIALVIVLPNWIGLQQGSGRWGSYPDEYAELNAHIQSLPKVRTHMVMVGGDTHNLWADSGARSWPEAAFPGIPSLNMSGYNRASPAETFFVPDIANATLIASGAEADWGGYSRLTVTDTGGSSVVFKWEAVRVDSAGNSDTMSTWSKAFTSDDAPQPPDPGSYASQSNSALELAWLRKVSGSSASSSLSDLKKAVFGSSERDYWAARSGLTSGSLSDHKLAAMKADTGASGSLSDVSRAFWAKNSV